MFPLVCEWESSEIRGEVWSDAASARAFNAVRRWTDQGGYNQWDSRYPRPHVGGPETVPDPVVVHQSGTNTYPRKVSILTGVSHGAPNNKVWISWDS